MYTSRSRAYNQVVQRGRCVCACGGGTREGLYQAALSISEIGDRICRFMKKESTLRAATYLAYEKYVLDQRPSTRLAYISREDRKIENRLLVDNRSFTMLTIATKWLTEALAPRKD